MHAAGRAPGSERVERRRSHRLRDTGQRRAHDRAHDEAAGARQLQRHHDRRLHPTRLGAEHRPDRRQRGLRDRARRQGRHRHRRFLRRPVEQRHPRPRHARLQPRRVDLRHQRDTQPRRRRHARAHAHRRVRPDLHAREHGDVRRRAAGRGRQPDRCAGRREPQRGVGLRPPGHRHLRLADDPHDDPEQHHRARPHRYAAPRREVARDRHQHRHAVHDDRRHRSDRPQRLLGQQPGRRGDLAQPAHVAQLGDRQLHRHRPHRQQRVHVHAERAVGRAPRR